LANHHHPTLPAIRCNPFYGAFSADNATSANQASSQSITNFSLPPKYHKGNFPARWPRHPTGKAEAIKNADIRPRKSQIIQIFLILQVQ
jgi:hypothetical protein